MSADEHERRERPASRSRVGLLGHGTVGAAFAELLDERADEIERFNGRRPVISGVLTRSQGDFERDPGRGRPARRADRRHRAGARVPAGGAARGQARRHRQQAAALPARRGAVRDRARARRAAALRGGGRRRRAGRARARGVAVGDADRAHPRDRQRHDQLHPHRDGRAARPTPRRSPRRSASATPRPIPATTSAGRDAAAKMAILARLAFGTPGAPRRRALRGHRASAARRPRSTRASSAWPQADRHRRAPRRAASRCACTPRSSTPATRWRAVSGPFNAVTRRVRGDHRDHDVGPGRGRARRPRARCSATSSA